MWSSLPNCSGQPFVPVSNPCPAFKFSSPTTWLEDSAVHGWKPTCNRTLLEGISKIKVQRYWFLWLPLIKILCPAITFSLPGVGVPWPTTPDGCSLCIEATLSSQHALVVEAAKTCTSSGKSYHTLKYFLKCWLLVFHMLVTNIQLVVTNSMTTLSIIMLDHRESMVGTSLYPQPLA